MVRNLTALCEMTSATTPSLHVDFAEPIVEFMSDGGHV